MPDLHTYTSSLHFTPALQIFTSHRRSTPLQHTECHTALHTTCCTPLLIVIRAALEVKGLSFPLFPI